MGQRFIDNLLKKQIKSNSSSSATATIPDGSITTAKLGTKAVTASKIADGTITLANLSSEVKAKLNS